MERQDIGFNDFNLNVIKVWKDDWFLLTGGEFAPGKFNMMTVAWGSFGVMWQKPFAQIVVRPQRHTRTLIDAGDSFTLTAFPAQYRKALGLCGSKSGRDVNKVELTGLTPIASQTVTSPAFAEAELIVECRKIYFDDFKPANFLADYIEPLYAAAGGADYHRMYFGEITRISGTPKYRV